MKSESQILYFCHGDQRNHRLETKFSILTALARLGRERSSIPIRVMTDVPRHFSGWPVEIVSLSREVLNRWLGEGRCIYRRKACVMEMGLEYAEKTLFMDTDTFFLADPSTLLANIDHDTCVVDEVRHTWGEAMHLPEYAGLVAGLVTQGGMPAHDLRLCASGVYGLAASNRPLVRDAIRRLDRWQTFGIADSVVGQIALSFSLYCKTLIEAKKSIRHYSASKRFFHEMISVFFEMYGERYTPELIDLCLDVPTEKPRPSPLDKLQAKWKLRTLQEPLREVGRSLAFGCAMPDNPYALACKRTWWSDALELLRSRNAPELMAFQQGRWPNSLALSLTPKEKEEITEFFQAKLAPARFTGIQVRVDDSLPGLGASAS